MTLEDVLRRERLITGLALGMVVALAWAYLLWFPAIMPMPVASPPAMDMNMDMGMDMDMDMDMGAMTAPVLMTWGVWDFALMASMWVAMMIGMMTPSATPMILLYSRVGQHAAARGKPFAPSAWFAAGYLLAWTAFAVVATTAQWGLESAALLGPGMAMSSRLVGGLALIAAGLYQWTPLKDVCLGKCRAPLDFIQQHGGFSPHATGSLRLGVLHGAYCIGCCWTLMLLLFVGGVMNLLWIAALMVLVLFEKLFPFGKHVSRVAGLALITAGVWLLATQ